MYDEIKKNIITNFINRNYRYASVMLKNSVINDIRQRFPFPFTYDYETDIMHIKMGNEVNIDLQFTWNYTPHKRYHLVKIS